MNIIDFPTERKLPTRTRPIRAVILHTTGNTDLDSILRFYQSEDGYEPHYFVETTGTIRRIVSEGKIAYHCAMHPNETVAYEAGFTSWSSKKWDDQKKNVIETGALFPGYATWIKTWRPQGMSSPLDLITTNTPNSVSIGIEMQQPDQDSITPDIFTDAQYENTAALLADIVQRNSLPLERKRVLGHYDVCPLRRSTTHGGWDPGEKFSWTRMFSLTTSAINTVPNT